MAESRSWLESRHLARSAEGAHAIARLGELSAGDAESVLAVADEFARSSVTLAHRFFVAAVQLMHDRPERYVWWADLVRRPLSFDTGGRALAQALLEVDAGSLAAVDCETVESWQEAVWELAGESMRLAAAYARGVGSALARTASGETPSLSAVRAWAQAVARVARAGAWRGELLAAHLAESADELLDSLDPPAVEAWADLVLAIGSAGRNPQPPAFPSSARVLPRWAIESILSVCVICAERAPSLANELLIHLARAVASLPEKSARLFLRAVESAGPSPELDAAVALVPAVLHDLRDEDVELSMSSALEVANGLPSALPAFLRSAGRALEEGGREGFRDWATLGIEVGQENEAAGLAHFRLETRTAHKVLCDHTAAVRFEEVEGAVQRYLRMIARRPLRAVAAPGIWLVPPIDSAHAELVRLPERVDLFRTAEDNQAFFLLAATHAAARWEYGTFDFRFSTYHARGLTAEGLSPPSQGEGLVSFLEAFPNPLLAVGLFALVEGIRIESRILRDFPGLAGDAERLASRYARSTRHAAGERTAEELIEALFLTSIGRIQPRALPPRLLPHAELVEGVRLRLCRAAADVYDSADLTARLYWTLTYAAARGGESDDVYDGMIELGGATAIDPLEHLEAGSAALPPPNSGPTPKVIGPDDPEPQDLTLQLDEGDGAGEESGVPMSPEELRELIEQGVDLRVTAGADEQAPSLGLYITQLLGKLPRDVLERLLDAVEAGDGAAVRAWLADQRGPRCFYYDEWDYLIRDYRRRWCQLRELDIEGDGGAFFSEALSRSRDLLESIRREFRMMRPEQFRKVRGMQHGDDFDLNAIVDAHADRRSRKNPSERLYLARSREERDVATLFLIDMSASTDEPLAGRGESFQSRRVIDVTKETLALMACVLDEIGDAHAIYGFSGHGRSNVEFYRAKSFSEPLSADVKSRLGGIEPKRSTRMGAALRHAAGKLARVTAKARHVILLSDGFPQDYDYGEDRTSNVYGLRDTTVALQELEAEGIRTFCITVDPAGHDYLGEMCPETRYAVIDDVEDLPLALPRIYRTVTRL